MISLTYLSTATARFSTSELSGLLTAARAKNQVNDLTGMLLHAGGHFIQTLEGPQDAVDTTFARIQRDTRHRNVDVALREEIDARIFPDWSMGFETLSAEEGSMLPGFNDYLDGKAMTAESREELGRAGIFHRLFRDNMR